jgi:anti-sigma factor RsiW
MGEPEMTCQELVEAITDYLEGALGADDRRRFERHLDGCQDCREYLAQMRETVRLTGALRSDDLSPALQERLLDAFRGWRRGRPHWPAAG